MRPRGARRGAGCASRGRRGTVGVVVDGDLKFERAAQLRDKINEMKGAPVLKSANDWSPDGEESERQKIWQPKTPRRGKRAAR